MRRTVSVLALMSLAACSSGYDPDRCSADGPDPKTLSDDAKDCIAKWGVALSTSKDSARDVAEAVMMACRDPIGDTIEPGPDDGTGDNSVGPSKVYADARRLSIFRVVEERAGHCSLKK